MTSEYQLHSGATALLSLPAGAEIFCAAGALHLRMLPHCAGALAQTQSIMAGQSWRAHSGALMALEALAASRYTLHLPHALPRPHKPENENASLWNRLALWMRRQWLLRAGHAGAGAGSR